MDTFSSAHWKDLLRQERIRRNWRQQDVADQLETTTVTIKRWERGSQQPSAYFRIKLCTLYGKNAEELGLVAMSPSPPTIPEEGASFPRPTPSSPAETLGLWTVPYLRNLHFTGRDEQLAQLAQHLSPEKQKDLTAMHRAVLSQAQAIKGLGGIGKTQIALEYAHRSRQQGRYTHIFWINAANEEAIITSFLPLADLLPDFSAKGETNQHKVIAAIKHWLEQCQEPWLLIFDNVDDLSLVQHYIPQQGNGSILLTTRAHAVAVLAIPIEVEQMGLIEGTQFLLHRTQRLNATDEEVNEASNVVIALDGFPLALDQAGAYIEETGCSFGDYVQLYEQHRTMLLARRGKQITNYPDSVATTWSLSFQQVEQAHPAAADLLRLCAYLSPDHIPEELIIEGAAHWPPVLQQMVVDRFIFNELIEALLAFSLVKRLAEEHLLSLHRLVQVVQLEQMDSQEQHIWARRVVCAVNTLFPANPKEKSDTWPQCLRYLEQVQACARLIQQHRLELPEAADLLDRAGVYLREHASYSLAEPLFQQALAILEQRLEPEHLRAASPLTNLGTLYYEQGKYELAEPLLLRALHINEQALGLEHSEVAYPLNNLGRLYWKQGKYERAEAYYQRALHINEQALGLEHSEVAYPLSNLGTLYYEQGKYELAEPLLLRALHIWEQALGPEHRLIAYPLTTMGILHYVQGKYELAEPLLLRALHIWEQALGSEHPQVAYPLNNLGELYCVQGKYERAESLLLRALHIFEQALGSNHPDIAYPLNCLGHLYYEQGEYERAEPYCQRALHIQEQALGPEHLRVAESLNGLANLSREQGQCEQAEALYRRALSIRQQHLSPQHLELAETLQDLARLRQMQQQLTEALSLYQQALAIREQALGAEHLKTIETRQRLCAMLQAQGKTEEVVPQEAHLDSRKQENGQVAGQEH